MKLKLISFLTCLLVGGSAMYTSTGSTVELKEIQKPEERPAFRDTRVPKVSKLTCDKCRDYVMGDVKTKRTESPEKGYTRVKLEWTGGLISSSCARKRKLCFKELRRPLPKREKCVLT